MSTFFDKRWVRAHWGVEGVEVLSDLVQRWGPNKIPDPMDDDTLEDYVRRCATDGLLHLAGDMRDQRDVRARLTAEEANIPCYQITTEVEDQLDAEAEYLEDTAAELRAFNPGARFEQYKAQRTDILTGATPESEEE
jgi:hypothetical protein